MTGHDCARKTVNDVRNIPEKLVLFGACNLCSALVQFVIRHDPAAKFRFAAIQSEIGREIFQGHALDPGDLQTFVFVADGRMFLRSELYRSCIALRRRMENPQGLAIRASSGARLDLHDSCEKSLSVVRSERSVYGFHARN